MDPYVRGVYYRDEFPRNVPASYDYQPPRRSYDPQPPVDPRTAQRVYAVAPAPVSYPALPSNRQQVEYHYYDPDKGLPFPMAIQPVPAPILTAAPPPHIQLSAGPGFQPGQTYKVVGVEQATYHAAPPQPRPGYVFEEHHSLPRGGYPGRRPPYF